MVTIPKDMELSCFICNDPHPRDCLAVHIAAAHINYYPFRCTVCPDSDDDNNPTAFSSKFLLDAHTNIKHPTQRGAVHRLDQYKANLVNVLTSVHFVNAVAGQQEAEKMLEELIHLDGEGNLPQSSKSSVSPEQFSPTSETTAAADEMEMEQSLMEIADAEQLLPVSVSSEPPDVSKEICQWCILLGGTLSFVDLSTKVCHASIHEGQSNRSFNDAFQRCFPLSGPPPDQNKPLYSQPMSLGRRPSGTRNLGLPDVIGPCVCCRESPEFSSPEALEQHRQQMAVESPFECEMCGRRFKQSCWKDRHQRENH